MREQRSRDANAVGFDAMGTLRWQVFAIWFPHDEFVVSLLTTRACGTSRGVRLWRGSGGTNAGCDASHRVLSM
jgi:hypothetical protein